MRLRITAIGLLLATSALAQTPAENDYAADEALLKSQGLPTKGPEVLRILRDRTPTPELIAEFQKQVKRLRSAAFAERMQATKELVARGDVVRPLLENLLLETNADLETVRRLRHVLEYFDTDKDLARMSAAARLIRRDKPAGSFEVLLAFVPYATNEYVRQDVQRALNAVGDKERLLGTLKDENAARRAAAAEALVRSFGAAIKSDIEPLLKDEHPLVRYQLGMALVETRDKAGLPLLIASLADAPPERVDFALELLYRAAGDDAPADYYSGKAGAAKFAGKWQAWLDKHGPKLDLPKQLAREELGFTVITTSAIGAKVAGGNKIFELGPDKTIRWQFDGPRYPVDIQVLGPNRLLLAEYTDRRVTERDFKGNVLWSVTLPTYPVACQRLVNGHTFIATRQQLMIVDRDGRNVFNHFNVGANGSIVTATRMRNGQFVAITSGQRCHILDRDGQELKTFALGGNVYPTGGNVDVLANGNILVPLYTSNSVVEFDAKGNEKWRAPVNSNPIAAVRLANGNTLVTCLNYRVVEINSAGQEVWSYQTDGRPFRARKR